jgi:phage tail-like protein
MVGQEDQIGQENAGGHVPLPDIGTSVADSFGLEVDGLFTSRLSDATGLKWERDVVEVQEDGPDGTVLRRKLPGRWQSPEVTLTRGVTADPSFARWVAESQLAEAGGGRRSGAISVFDGGGALLKKYLFTNAWPKSFEITTLEAGGTPHISERLVLVCERLEPQ